MWHKKKNSDNEELIVTNDAVERKLPDNNEKEQPDFAEEKTCRKWNRNFWTT